mgnify:CR=1 FL=1
MTISGVDLYREYLRREKIDETDAFPYEFMDPDVAGPWELTARSINSLKMTDPIANIKAIRPGNALP